MNYGKLIYNKKGLDCLFFFYFENRGVEMYFRVVGALCIRNCYFKCVYRIRCLFCIYEHSLKICFDIL